MLSLPKFGMSEYAKKNTFLGLLTYVTPKSTTLSFEDIFWGTLDTYTKKMNPPSTVFFWGGGVHGKISWLIAYYVFR